MTSLIYLVLVGCGATTNLYEFEEISIAEEGGKSFIDHCQASGFGSSVTLVVFIDWHFKILFYPLNKTLSFVYPESNLRVYLFYHIQGH